MLWLTRNECHQMWRPIQYIEDAPYRPACESRIVSPASVIDVCWGSCKSQTYKEGDNENKIITCQESISVTQRKSEMFYILLNRIMYNCTYILTFLEDQKVKLAYFVNTHVCIIKSSPYENILYYKDKKKASNSIFFLSFSLSLYEHVCMSVLCAYLSSNLSLSELTVWLSRF